MEREGCGLPSSAYVKVMEQPPGPVADLLDSHVNRHNRRKTNYRLKLRPIMTPSVGHWVE